MTSPFDAAGIPYVFDATSLGWGQDCLWKYKASMIDRWRARSNSVHLVWGGWYAEALETFHRMMADGWEREDAIRAVVLAALTNTWDTEKNVPWEADHPSKTRDNLIRSIVWYFEEFNPDPLPTVILSNGKPAVEHSFAIEIDNELVWAGHLDRLVTYEGGTYIQDQKSTGSTIGPYWFDNFSIDVQMSGYVFAGQALFNIPVKGVIIDGAQVAVGFTAFQRGFSFRTQPMYFSTEPSVMVNDKPCAAMAAGSCRTSPGV